MHLLLQIQFQSISCLFVSPDSPLSSTKNVYLLSYVLTTTCPYPEFRVAPIIGYMPLSCRVTRFFSFGNIHTSLAGEGVGPIPTLLAAEQPSADPPTVLYHQQQHQHVLYLYQHLCHHDILPSKGNRKTIRQYTIRQWQWQSEHHSCSNYNRNAI